MDANDVVAFVKGLGGVDGVEGNGDWFLFYDPGRKLPVDRRFPFVTVVTGDRYDAVSKLGEGRFRVNVGVGKEGYRRLFREEREWDFAARDVVMPHPVYGMMGWVCVVNPEGTWEEVKGLIKEAWEVAAGKDARRRGGTERGIELGET